MPWNIMEFVYWIFEEKTSGMLGSAVRAIALMMEAVSSFETSVIIYQIRRLNIPEDRHVHSCRREYVNLTFLLTAVSYNEAPSAVAGRKSGTPSEPNSATAGPSEACTASACMISLIPASSIQITKTLQPLLFSFWRLQLGTKLLYSLSKLIRHCLKGTVAFDHCFTGAL
jgi:hypothetical protein